MAVVDANYDLQAPIGLQVPNREHHLHGSKLQKSASDVFL